MNEDSSFNLAPKNIFLVGLVFGLLVAGTAGFVWSLTNGSSGSKSAPVALGDPNQPPTAQAEPIIAPVTDKDHIRGDLTKAKVVLIEYSDLECPYCKQFHPALQQMVKEYGDKVAWVYRHFPLTQIHPKAVKEAEASECANELGGSNKFWEFIDKVYEITPGNNQLDPAQLPIIATQIGLDKTKFETCLNSNKYSAKIQADIAAAAAAGAQGTPYSILLAGNQKIPLEGAVPFEQIKSALDQLIK
jgi:protein-disulfide isomerase